MPLPRAFTLSVLLKCSCVVLLLLLMLVVNGEPAAAACDDDIKTLIVQCARFVSKIGPQVDPSSQCCEVVQQTDLTCICSHVTKQIENMISMDKALHVAACCNKSVPHGYQCGSYKVPLA